MTPNQIIENHIKNNNIDVSPEQFAKELNAFRKIPGNYVARQGDCLFLYQKEGEAINMFIVNGGGSVSYIKAVRAFIKKMQEIGAKELKIRVQDKEASAAIARSVGAIRVEFEETHKGSPDPYTLTFEI